MPDESELADAIGVAAERAIGRLFREQPESFYYCSLITTGEAHAPFLAAWSVEKLAGRKEIKWSYADCPYCDFSPEDFEAVRKLFAARPAMDSFADCSAEYELRLRAMEAALRRLDAKGIFGSGPERNRIVVNVEVMPPDHTNTERALRLNPLEALGEWLAEAAE